MKIEIGTVLEFDLPDVMEGKGSTPVKLIFGKDGISIQPKGMAVYDGDYAPILIEKQDDTIRLVYWGDINQQEPEILDMSGALESSRHLVKDDYEDGVCGDCQEPIPDDAMYGEACVNCGHVWNPVAPCDDGRGPGE
ncbi:MAG: hypothetical protein M0R80_23575 [Proteobacteria bacterium]|jgi:hypothetical protein|nr:hypothetical protein [Pseudomonadota bacterium]